MDLPLVIMMNTQIGHLGFFSKIILNNKIIKIVDTWQHIIHFIVDQISHMVIANNNTHTITQRMKPYFVDFFLSSTIHVICDYGHM